MDSDRYADDYHDSAVSPEVDVITERLNTAAEKLVEWADGADMSISAPKSTATLFTPWTKQVNASLDIKIGDDAVPTVKNPKLLGVNLDPMFTLSVHADTVARKASSRLNILRALSDTNFGFDVQIFHPLFV